MLPDWARCDGGRYEHAARVAELLDRWALELGFPERERTRWRAAGFLHDALKDEAPDNLRDLVDSDWPDPVLHAPACAARLRADGVGDEGLLLAVAYHSVGHPDFEALGEFLFMADFLEPGRPFLANERSELRGRLPRERHVVLAAVLAYRIEKQLRKRNGLMPESIRLWNRVVGP